ncbi:MAG: peptidoglycan DD-metalloendopeptidase family protein [Bifidobacteriaceae bacterium]|nr:peptidoglycan DD-metalloendopeptidase family protein [Bifidobacteriaceae bacterium]
MNKLIGSIRFRATLAGFLAAFLAAFALVAGLAVQPVQAAKDRDDLERERAANQKQLEQLKIELEGTSEELQKAYLALEAANQELPVAQAAVEVAQSEYAAAQQEYQETQAALAQAESQRDEVTEQLAQEVALVEESRQSLGALARDAMMGNAAASSDLMVLMGATSIDDAAQNLIAAGAAARTREAVIAKSQQSAAANKNRKARLETVTVEIAGLKAKAEAALVKAEDAKAAAEQAKRDLEELQASLEDLAATLETQKAADEAEKAEREAQDRKLQAELDQLLADEARKAGLKPGGGGGAPPSTPGFFGRPLNSISVSSPFGWRTHPISGTQRHHDGVDLGAGCGAPIYASAAGTVIYTGVAGGYGNRTVISHGNVNGSLMFSTYNHQAPGGILVSVGDSVSKGQHIGVVGTTGASTGCHLHFEIGVGSATGVVNPMNYIS